MPGSADPTSCLMEEDLLEQKGLEGSLLKFPGDSEPGGLPSAARPAQSAAELEGVLEWR